MLLRENLFERASELFFEAAAVPELWPNALHVLSEAYGALGAILLPVGEVAGATVNSKGIDEYIADFLGGGWLSTNSRMRRGLELTQAGKKGFITCTDMFSAEELRRDRFYNEFIAPRRMGATAGIVLAHSAEEFILPISFERSASSGPFVPGEVARMNRHVSHLRCAAALAISVGMLGTRSLADGLAVAGRDVALLSGSGRVLHASPSFEQLFGDALGMRNGFLSSWHMETDRRLRAATNKAVQRSPTTERTSLEIALPRKRERGWLRAQLVPLTGSAQDVFMLARAAVIVTDPDAVRSMGGDTALASFDLTRAEARLARRIAAGEDLKRIAREESISFETARTRLKAVFGKTETHRQVELALKIAALLH